MAWRMPSSHSDGSTATAYYPKVGDTLTTLTTSGYVGTRIADADGLTNATFTYQWMRGDGTTYTDIPNATGMNYSLVDADEDKRLKVRVSFSDDEGNQETLISAPSAEVAPVPTPSANNTNNPAQGDAVITGTAQVGETLTVDVSGITDSDGMENASFNFTWFVDYDTEMRGGIVRGGSLRNTWTIEPRDAGKELTVVWDFDDDLGYRESGTVTTATVEATVPSEPRAVAVEPGGTGELDVSWFAPASDGGSPITGYKVQWKEASDSWDTAVDVSETTTTGTSHTISRLSLGTEYTVRVIATNSAGDSPASREVEATADAQTLQQQVATQNSPATGGPSIVGTAEVGQTLSAETSDISDTDGLAGAAFSYQWLADGTAIQGATGSTYTLVEADEGKPIKVRVSFTDDGGNDETLTSAATEAVAGNEEPVAREDVAAWSATMTVEWVYQGYGYYSTDAKKAGSLSPASFKVDGTTYTVKMVETQGWWMYIGVDRELPFDFVLELDGARFASNDASFRSYSYGNIYRWEGTGLSWRDGDTVEVRLLRAFEDETAVNSAATGAPIISGTVQVGETLTVDTSGIADTDGLENSAFTYQWLADDTAIQGAMGSSYTLADTDEGKTIKVRVSFTDDTGNGETLTSTATDAVAAATQPNNPATGAPAINGTAQVAETLTADTSDIADADWLEKVTLSYQWLADDTTTQGATGSTYTILETDEGKAIKVRVSFTDDGGNDETLTSEATDPVAAVTQPNSPATGAPTISGTAQVGETLTGGHLGHFGCRRVDQRFLQLPVAGR